MSDATALIADLAAEHDALDAVVAGLDPGAWSTRTPAAGWDVRDQISHLCYFDGTALLALTNPGAFADHAPGVGRVTPGEAPPDVALGRSMTPDRLLTRWRSERRSLGAALAANDPRARIPWYGPPMGLASFVTARIMETWAHGTDVRDALGVLPSASPRLRHVCDIGIRARPYAFAVHQLADPGAPIRVEVSAPSGEAWTWGPPEAPDRVAGPALDLALLVTQRRHRDDLALTVTGRSAQAWIGVAQSFAGPAGPGRSPLGSPARGGPS